MSRLIAWLALALLLAGCRHDPMRQTEDSLVWANELAGHAFGPEISAEDLAAHIRVLSSDAFAGRAPGTVGEERSVGYLREQFQRLGLQPGNEGSYFQIVPMVATRADRRRSEAAITVGGQTHPLLLGSQAMIVARRGEPQLRLEDLPMMFVGYGVSAPERHWDDYAGVDVRGKVVVVLVNDPGFHARDPNLFDGPRMTYYGRWTYKFEEAVRHGAAAALIVHDTAGAGYGWDVVQNSWGDTQYDLTAADDPAPRLQAQGWLRGDIADALFADAGFDAAQLRAAADRPGFHAIALGDARLRLALTSQVHYGQSRNVVARLPGTAHADEAIVYTAHWDHLGTRAGGRGDRIFNGAIDNASGVAGLLEIAEQFTVQQPRPERSIVFLATTLEESGLLGSQYYVHHPLVPLAKTVAAINLDAMPMVGPTRDLVVVGLGQSELDDVLRPIAAAQERVLVAEPAPEKGTFFRSDHFSFARAGVPALYLKGGVDHREKGRTYGLSVLEAYTAKRYHQPSDEFDPDWDMRGVVEDLDDLYEVGRQLSLDRAWPNYRPGSEFRAARDALRPPGPAPAPAP